KLHANARKGFTCGIRHSTRNTAGWNQQEDQILDRLPGSNVDDRTGAARRPLSIFLPRETVAGGVNPIGPRLEIFDEEVTLTVSIDRRQRWICRGLYGRTSCTRGSVDGDPCSYQRFIRARANNEPFDTPFRRL